MVFLPLRIAIVTFVGIAGAAVAFGVSGESGIADPDGAGLGQCGAQLRTNTYVVPPREQARPGRAVRVPLAAPEVVRRRSADARSFRVENV